MSEITSINSNLIQIGGNLLQVITVPPAPSLPPYTLRLRYEDGVTPELDYGTWVQVSSNPNIWDWTYEDSYWETVLQLQTQLLEVIDGNTSGVTNMSGMFYGCSSLTSVSLFDTSSVTDMGIMFAGCTSLTSVPLFNTSGVTNMGSMFQGCTSLTTVPLFATSNVTDMSSMFRNCTSLTTVPLFNTSNVTTMMSILYECSSLTSIPLFNTSKVTNIGLSFYNCGKVETGALAIYQQASSQDIPPSNHSQTFYNCGSNTTTGSAELAQIPSDWK